MGRQRRDTQSNGPNTRGGPCAQSGPYAHTLRKSELARWEVRLNMVAHSKIPEERLWAAVLVEAVRDLLRTPFEARFREVVRWIGMRSPGYALGTFDGTCLQLGLDEDIVRADLLERAKSSRIALARRAA